ncbi:MAG: ATP-binding protein [Gammaproteobacteria bacterium]|nr:ATP-binding protein [Gammaproteobacteria bacterium]
MNKCINEHPIFMDQFLDIPMPSHDRLRYTIQQWIWLGMAGGFVSGDARDGKSVSVRIVKDRFKTRTQVPIPSLYITIPDRDKKTIRSVMFSIFTELKLKGSPGGYGTADKLANQIRMEFREIVHQASCNRIILFVDEAQRLTTEQMNAFAELYDKMAVDKIQLSVIFIANLMESQKLLKSLVKEHKFSHIKGRFLTQALEYKGITSQKDVKFILRQYDRIKDPDTHQTYTEYFLPEAVHDKNFKLASLAPKLWKCYRQGIKKELKLDKWTSQYFFSTVNSLLTYFLPSYGTETDLEELIEAAIEASGIRPTFAELIV